MTATCAAFVGQSATATRATWIAASSVVGAATICDKGRDGRGGAIIGWLCVIQGFVVYVLSQVKDDAYHFVRREEVVGVERVDDTLFCQTKVSIARDAAEHEKSKVVRMDGIKAIVTF
jgi:hypothetical protein